MPAEEKRFTRQKMLDHQSRILNQQKPNNQRDSVPTDLALPSWDISALTSFLLSPNAITARQVALFRGWLGEIQKTRNSWAHQKPLSIDDTFRALDTIEKLMDELGHLKAAKEVQIPFSTDSQKRKQVDEYNPNSPFLFGAPQRAYQWSNV
eukprot:gene12288-14405_t